MKKKILTLFGISLFIIFLNQIKLELLSDVVNVKNLIFFFLSICLVILTNIILYFRFKVLVKIFFQKNFFKEFIYFKFLSILSFKDVGDIISKLYILNKQAKIKKSQNFTIVFYEKIFDALLTVIILTFALLSEMGSIEIKLFLIFAIILVLNLKIVRYLINLANSWLTNKLKKNEIQHLVSNHINFCILTFLKILLIIARYSLLLIICDINFDIQKLLINFGVFQFLSLISFSPGGIGIFDLLAYKSTEIIYTKTEIAIIFVLLNRISTVLGTFLIFIASKYFKFINNYFKNR